MSAGALAKDASGTGAGRKRRALVLGGSGYVGAAVVRELLARGVDVTCTYFTGDDRAHALRQAGASVVRADLRERSGLGATLDAAGRVDIVVHAAGVFHAKSLADSDDATYEETMRLAVRAPFGCVQELAKHWDGASRADIVLVSALDRAQNLALPVCFAAGEGAKGALAMALAKELGEKNVRVNTVALGLLDGGMSAALGEAMAQDFAQFSALGRRGTAEEVARVIAFLVLDSEFLTGRSIAVNGGL